MRQRFYIEKPKDVTELPTWRIEMDFLDGFIIEDKNTLVPGIQLDWFKVKEWQIHKDWIKPLIEKKLRRPLILEL